MSDYNVSDKSASEQWTHTEHNAMKTALNSKADTDAANTFTGPQTVDTSDTTPLVINGTGTSAYVSLDNDTGAPNVGFHFKHNGELQYALAAYVHGLLGNIFTFYVAGIDNAMYIQKATGKTVVPGVLATDSKFAVGGIELQPIAVNHNIISDNLYYNNGTFVLRANGYASFIQFLNGDILFKTVASGIGGADATPITGFKITNAGGIEIPGLSGTGTRFVRISSTGVVSASTDPANDIVLTGYSSGAGTVAATDTILQAIQKLNGNTAALPTATSTTTLTNKRITKRIGTVASSATPTPTADTADIYTVTALAANATFAAPTGTPTDGQELVIRIKDNGTARTLAWNAIYRGGTDLALPTTTVINKTMYIQFVYNAADTKWDLLGLTGGI